MPRKRKTIGTAEVPTSRQPCPPEADAEISLPTAVALVGEPARTGQKTAKLALKILRDTDPGFVVPTAKQRVALAIAYATAGYVIYGKAFDIVRCSSKVNLDDVESIGRNLETIVIFEIKATDKKSVKPDFRGYFFAITAAELLVAQSLGDRYRFAFVNTITRTHVELSLRELFARARRIYPTWSISF